jgi:hypothetical protein
MAGGKGTHMIAECMNPTVLGGMNEQDGTGFSLFCQGVQHADE